MADLKVGTWNAHNSFGNEHIDGAFEIVKTMDVDVLNLCELTPNDIDLGILEEIHARMYELGYKGEITDVTPYTGVRNAHKMSLWSRELDTDINVKIFGKRHGFKAIVPSLGAAIYGFHLDDASVDERNSSAEAVVQDSPINDHEEALVTGIDEAIAMGDFNAMLRKDPKSRVPRAVGHVIGGFEVNDYYDETKKIQRILGKFIRVGRMANRSTTEIFINAGFHDADPEYRATIGEGRLRFKIDHILASAGIVLEGFTRHSRFANKNSEPLSDHYPITAIAER